MEELIIVHRKPEVEFYTGKWTITEGSIFFYIFVEGKRMEATLKSDVANHIKAITIGDSNVIGNYDRSHQLFEYKLDLAKHNLVVEEIGKETNLFIVKFK